MIPAGEQDPDAWQAATSRILHRRTRTTCFRLWDAAETAGYGAVGVLAIGAAFLVVRRRRPYA